MVFQHLRDLTLAAEKLANDPKEAVAITDWACGMYDRLTTRNAQIFTADLLLLEEYYQTGKTYLIARRILEIADKR